MSGGGGGGVPKKPGSSVRSALNDQLAKIQMKHLAEMDLLDEFRSFLKQRCQLEKEYAQGLQRLAQQYLMRKEIKPPPELADFDRLENRGVLEVWKLMLTKVEEQGKRRAEVTDMLQTSISEMLKNLRKDKEQQFKVSCEVMQKMISEVLDSVKELTTSKKVYSERQKMSEEARQKYSDLDDRLRKKEMKLFQSRSTLEKNHKKSADKLRSAQKRAVAARNEYLLCLAVSNTQLRKHFVTDLPSAMKTLDGEMYDKMRNAYMLFAQIEADSCNAIKAEFEDLREQAQLVNREYVMECFLYEFPSLRNKILYKFEPAAGDKVEAISKDHGAELLLNKQARYWAQELIKHQQMVVEKSKAIRGLQSVSQAYEMTPEFGTADARAEAQQSMNSLQEEIRQLEVVTTRANARLDALSEGGIDVNKWLQQAASTSSGEHLDRKTSQSQTPAAPPPDLLDVRSLASSFSGSQLSLASIETGSENADTQALDSISLGSNPPNVPLQQSKYCIALYSYQAQRSDELDIQTDEELEVIEWDDGDGWSRGKNKFGQEGYFPQSYVQATNVSPVSSSPCLPKLSITSSNDGVMLRALYEYTGEDMEELSFPEGAIIRLLRTDADENGVDDGWWQGSYEGKVGVFPSVIVEVISGDPQSILSSDLLTPVASEISTTLSYTPPPPPLPPPDYPAPEISAEDLAIGPNLRAFPSMFNADFLSGMTASPGPTSTPAKTDSWSQQMSTSPHRLDRAPTLVNESLERTLCSSNRWSSFEDIDDNESESFV